jgi:hypothetical protein
MKQQINEFKRMQLIAGLITESEYRQSLSEEMELPKVGDKFSYEGDEIQITGVDDKFVDAKSTKKDKTYNFGLRAWKEGFKGSKLNEMDEAEKMDESILKVYVYDPSSYKLEDVETYSYPSEEEAQKAAVAYNWQIAHDNGDTDLSKEEYIQKYSWDDLDDISYDDYGYEIVK